MITLDPRSPVFDANHKTGQGRADLRELFPGVFSPTGRVSLDSVVHNYSTREGYDQLRDSIANHVPDGIGDEWFDPQKRSTRAIAKTPTIAGRSESVDFYLSQRNSPPLFGLGLIDQIPGSQLDSLVTRQATQSRRTGSAVTGRRGVGKFGWRAQTTTLARFVRGACTGELGLSQRNVQQPMDPVYWAYRNPGVDISEKECTDLTAYVASIEKPKGERLHSRSRSAEGRRHFMRIGCAACHVENLDVAKGIYSDLLLHDMGSRLQAPSPAPIRFQGSQPTVFLTVKSFVPSNSQFFAGSSISGYYGTPGDRLPQPFVMANYQRKAMPEFPNVQIPLDGDIASDSAANTWEALQREWRTPPLWGIASTAPYLHDGRAETIDDAIRWHGGEAANTISKYENMADRHREKLLLFLKSLVAPSES